MSKALKFLVIDDDDTVQSIVAAFINRYLEENNLTGSIKRITDPIQGLFVLNTNGNDYDVILLDVRLPKLTGDEIYNSLLALEQDFIKRIVFVTGYANDLISRFPDLKLNILNKPFRYQDLSTHIDELLKLD